MNALLGIIRLTAKANGIDTAYFNTAVHKFPSAFTGTANVAMPCLQMLGDLQSSEAGLQTQPQVFFFGDIFNKKEIAALAGLSLDSTNNAALVQALIQTKGINSIKKINGQFAIIYYDQVNNKISIINDHLGVQQIVYYQDDNILLFGTEVKFLLTHPDCPKGIDWAAALKRPMPSTVLGSYKSYDTWFNGIKLLPEASILETDLQTGSSTLSNYWKPQDATISKDDKRTSAQVMEEYTALLEDAVKIRMNAGGPTHSLLSGGLDSSAICALAAKHGPIETYSIINQTTVLEDTTSFCHQMATDYGFANSQFLVPYHDLCFDHKLWKQRVWRTESPVNHTDSLTKTMLHYAIRKNNPEAKNILSGTGSDQMNGGLVGYIATAGDTHEESWNNFHNAVLDVEHQKLVSRNEESLWGLRKFISREFLSSASGVPLEDNSWMIYLDGAIHSQAYSLLWDEQRASSSHGHTTFYPFMDFRIADFIAAIPHHLHKELFYDKQILREPSKQFLPDYIVNKPKAPYNLPEYDVRAQAYAFLTADDANSLFTEAFGDIDTPHPVVNKKQLYSRIQAMRQQPEMLEWLHIMHIINLGLLEKLSEKNEAELDYESTLDIPAKISFDDPAATINYLQKALSILTTDELIDKPIKFGENCSFLLDTKSNKYYLSKRNNLTYEIDDEYADWKSFLIKIDNKLTTRQILNDMGIEFGIIEEFFRLSLKEQILVISDKKTGY